MNAEYAETFAHRGAPYDKAMQLWPEARAAEFRRLFDRFPAPAEGCLVDFPAGGGYLSRYLPSGLNYIPLELTTGFGAGITDIVELDGDWTIGQADRLVCLAAMHHMGDHEEAIRRLMSKLLPGGRLHIADVSVESPISRFLDEFVGAHNNTGHDGHYLSEVTPQKVSGAVIDRWERVDCPWIFDSRQAAAKFCGHLFGLADISADAILDALETYVGLEEDETCVRILWHLLYADLRKEI